MKNPWINLPDSEPYVLRSDADSINKFNRSTNKSEHIIHTELLPEPFLGNPQAKVVLLNLNPGYCDEDIIYHQNNEYFKDISRKNLLHQLTEHCFYLLDPQIHEAPGYKWWYKRLRQLINAVGLTNVSQKVLCVECFPYHSQKYNHGNISLESQSYSFHLVRMAMKRNAKIIVMRAWKQWLKVIPELKDYPVVKLKSSQCAYITKDNLPDGEFEKLVELLTHS